MRRKNGTAHYIILYAYSTIMVVWYNQEVGRFYILYAPILLLSQALCFAYCAYTTVAAVVVVYII